MKENVIVVCSTCTMLYASYLNGVRFGAAVIDEGEQIFEEDTVAPLSRCA